MFGLRWAAGQWDRPVWVICERTDRSFWAEPVNAASTFAFVLVAALLLLRWRRAGGGDPAVPVLIALVVAIGAGSFAFHTLATRGALVADRLPIMVFAVVYAMVALRRLVALPWLGAIAVAGLFLWVAQSWAAATPWHVMNGYARHLPAIGIVATVALATLVRAWATDQPLRARALGASGLKLVAAAGFIGLGIWAGANDRPYCPTTAFGLHPFWHLSAAVAVGLLVDAVIGQGRYSRARLVAREAA